MIRMGTLGRVLDLDTSGCDARRVAAPGPLGPPTAADVDIAIHVPPRGA
jgi:hypothetical protein